MTSSALDSAASRLPADWRDLLALTKPRVMSLVVFTGLCGMLAAPVLPPLAIGFTAILCIALGAGAAGALNQWYEADLDALMRRTASRPLPAGRMDRQTALHFGVGLGAFSVVLMDVAANHLAALLLAASILFYVFVYTIWLKRRTAQNIVIGGAAGAFPPLIGWVAATGEIAPLPLILFAIIFLWTPPHFWALSLFVRSDYAAAKVPMLPVTAGIEATRRQVFLYSLPMAAARKTAVRLFGHLSVRTVRGARGRPVDRRMTQLEDEVVKRQRERARLMAWLLGGFVILLFLVTVAKIGLNR
jgi:protoheme IX farnesyltransferase